MIPPDPPAPRDALAALPAGALPYEVRFDGTRRRLHWTMRGFWTLREVGGLAEAMRSALAPLGPRPHRYDGLCDSRDFPVQTAEVSHALGRIDQAGATMRQGRMAIVVGSTLNKLQAQRTLTSPDVRIFETLDSAQAWLNEERPQQ